MGLRTHCPQLVQAAAWAHAEAMLMCFRANLCRRSPEQLTGRTCTNRRVVFPDTAVSADWVRAATDSGIAATGSSGRAAERLGAALGLQPLVQLRPGDYAAVRVDPVQYPGAMATEHPLGRVESLGAFHALAGNLPFFAAASAVAEASGAVIAARAAAEAGGGGGRFAAAAAGEPGLLRAVQ